MLNLFALFHLNLMYSSIAEADRPEVIRRCYHPLLDLAERGMLVAIEASALTLELIRELDPAWMDRLRHLVEHGDISFVGSGYSQIIGPLVPACVNARNLELGRESYEHFFACSPRIWLINEMTYSAGLPRLYRETAAEAVIMEWNNARSVHPEWSPHLAFHQQVAVGAGGVEIPVIWVNTIDFQQLQRLTHGAITQSEFMTHWRGRADRCGGSGFAAFYGNDAEVFDFRPGRYGTEEPLTTGEWGRLENVMRLLDAAPEFQFVPIEDVLEEPAGKFCGRTVRLETAGMPIVVKKQEKYNLSRWALTGRGDLEANTACYRIAEHLDQGDSQDRESWCRLCRMWSSDLRTHITPPRWDAFMAEAAADWGLDGVLSLKPPSPAAVDGPHPQPELATTTVKVVADLRRGLSLREVVFPEISSRPVIGTIGHGFFEDIALGADFYTGHSVVQRPGSRKLTDLIPCGDCWHQGVTPEGRVFMGTEIHHGEMMVSKQIVLFSEESRLDLRGTMELKSRLLGQVHPVHITIIPGFFDTRTLAYGVFNGGRDQEIFSLRDATIDHGQSYSTLITAKGGLGATDGTVMIGDKKRRLVIRHDQGISALIPLVHYVPQPDGRPFLRLIYSAQEIDETFCPSDQPWQVSWAVSITAEDRGLEIP